LKGDKEEKGEKEENWIKSSRRGSMEEKRNQGNKFY
jgi:hypothetical protein